MYKISGFCQIVSGENAVIYKSHRTGAVATLSSSDQGALTLWLSEQLKSEPRFLGELVANGILVPAEMDEFVDWNTELLETRNDKAHVFTLHFEPTIQCQMSCSYCFENGADRGVGMKDEVLQASFEWLRMYLQTHKEIDALRLVFFGGEPLLRKDLVARALVGFRSVAKECGCDFWSEIITNGELLSEEIARTLSENCWKRIQITLDGPRVLHDKRRAGKGGRPTFDAITNNIRMVLARGLISHVDIRMTFDHETRDRLPELIDELAVLGLIESVRLSLGIVTPYLGSESRHAVEEETAAKAVAVWSHAKKCGFAVPDEFISGPLCVALAKHSAVLQPDGGLQKCFCTSGRKAYDFGSVFSQPESYTKDDRYENFRRTEECMTDECQFLPICGGGCTYHAHVATGSEEGFHQRFCQKTLLGEMNAGLLKLSYS